MTPAPDHGETSYVGKGLLVDRVALITGGDSGIGRAVAIAYAREGADVAISYLPVEQSDAEETARWIENAGRRALLLPGDLRDESHCRAIVARTVAELGRLDILVNNAAAQTVNEGLDDVTAADLEGSFRANVFAMYYLCQAAVPQMRPGSAIVNSTSQQAKIADATMLIYAATKGAIASLTIGLSNLLAPKGIRVNCVAPARSGPRSSRSSKRPNRSRSSEPTRRSAGPGSLRSSRRPTCCSPRARAATCRGRSSPSPAARQCCDHNTRHRAGRLSPPARA